MARKHIVSPLPACYLRKLADLLTRFAAAYTRTADLLKEPPEIDAAEVEKFESLQLGISKIFSHATQVVDQVERQYLEKLVAEALIEPLPDRRRDLAKHSKASSPKPKPKNRRKVREFVSQLDEESKQKTK